MILATSDFGWGAGVDGAVKEGNKQKKMFPFMSIHTF